MKNHFFQIYGLIVPNQILPRRNFLELKAKIFLVEMKLIMG